MSTFDTAQDALLRPLPIPDTTPECYISFINVLNLRFPDELDKVTLRFPIKLKQGKCKHDQKISKEVWLQAALELFKSMPVDWSVIQSIDQMHEKLQILENGLCFLSTRCMHQPKLFWSPTLADSLE